MGEDNERDEKKIKKIVNSTRMYASVLHIKAVLFTRRHPAQPASVSEPILFRPIHTEVQCPWSQKYATLLCYAVTRGRQRNVIMSEYWIR